MRASCFSLLFGAIAASLSAWPGLSVAKAMYCRCWHHGPHSRPLQLGSIKLRHKFDYGQGVCHVGIDCINVYRALAVRYGSPLSAVRHIGFAVNETGANLGIACKLQAGESRMHSSQQGRA